jgi:hypothetical protein
MHMALDECLPTDAQQGFGSSICEGSHTLTTTGRQYHCFHGFILQDYRITGS